MRTILSIFAIFVFTACQPSSQEKVLSADEKLSLQLGNATLWFQQSAEREASFRQAYDKGKMLLQIKMDTLSTSDLKPAVVLDLDETVLDNSPYEARLWAEGKNYSSESWSEWCKEAQAEALPGAVDFLHFADSLGFEIFYVSNRKIEVFESTLHNLKSLELPQSEEDHLMLRTTTSDKTERRETIKTAHQVLLYVGDNLTDYSEVFANRDSASQGRELTKEYRKELLHNFIALPNPMYGEWESAIYQNDFSKTAAEKIEARKRVLDLKR